MANNFNPGFDREKAAFIALANRGEGLTPINYLYAKEASFESILSPVITGGTAELYTIYATGINSASITNTEDIITNRLKWSNPSNDYYVGFTAGNLTGNTIWRLPLQDGTDGQVIATNGNGILSFIDAGGGSAPKDATYIIRTPNTNLPKAQVLEELGTGMAKIVAGGAFAIAIAGEDYATIQQLEEIEQQCQLYAEQAAASAEEAATSAAEASGSAAEAATSAAEASGSAVAATAAAAEATAAAAEATAAAAEASAAAAEASGSAVVATASAVAAAVSALAAGISAGRAGNSADAASSSANSASNSAEYAASSASSASVSANDSANSATQAQTYLNTLLNTGLTLLGDVTGSGLLSTPIVTTFEPNPIFTGNSSMTMPTGNSMQRPSTLTPGMIRFNTSL
jgi:hypothetical protein